VRPTVSRSHAATVAMRVCVIGADARFVSGGVRATTSARSARGAASSQCLTPARQRTQSAVPAPPPRTALPKAKLSPGLSRMRFYSLRRRLSRAALGRGRPDSGFRPHGASAVQGRRSSSRATVPSQGSASRLIARTVRASRAGPQELARSRPHVHRSTRKERWIAARSRALA
jgi:hypothetical protein